MSSVAEFYTGRSILVTGATGFMGKVLVEKLLRSCPQIGSIYLLMRPKRGQQVKARIHEMLNGRIFDWLRKNQNESLSKLVPICGDITMPELGLNEEDQRLLVDNVSIVFHSAATVKFDEALKLSVAMNLTGTKRLLALCYKMTKLEALVHVSTAYCNCNRTEVAEQVYPAPADPERIMQMVEVLDEQILQSITPQLIRNRPNTYTFTKALAEQLIMDQGGRLPVAIVRPSIVTASWKEPLPGWVDNLNGPTGLIAGAGKGVLRSLFCYRDNIADLIPVDVAINLMISVGWYTAVARPNNVMVYNCTSGAINPVLWRDVEKIGHSSMLKHPFSDVLWYPGGSFKNNKLMNQICVAAFHTAPAYIYDFIAWLTGRKPIMIRVQTKLQRAVSCLEFFTTNEFIFSNDNVLNLLQQLSPEDKKFFDFDIRPLNWSQYIETYVLGTRKFILKEDPSTLPLARQQMRRKYMLHRLTQLMALVALWRVLLLKSETLRKSWYYVLVFILRLLRTIMKILPQLSV